jgi:hypothetical protein
MEMEAQQHSGSTYDLLWKVRKKKDTQIISILFCFDLSTWETGGAIPQRRK